MQGIHSLHPDHNSLRQLQNSLGSAGDPPLLDEPAVEMAWPLTVLQGGWEVRKEITPGDRKSPFVLKCVLAHGVQT